MGQVMVAPILAGWTFSSLTRIMCAHDMWNLPMNITLAIDEQVADSARKAAQSMGKSLNQVVRDYLEQLAGSQQTEAAVVSFEQSARSTPGRLKGWQFDREEANERA